MNPLHSPIPLDAGFRRTLFARRSQRGLWLRRLLAYSGLAVGLLLWLGWPLDAHAMRIKEIAAVLNVTESRICQLHSQSVARLRAKLRDH